MLFCELAMCFKSGKSHCLFLAPFVLIDSETGSPIWRTEVFCGEFGDAYVKDSGLEGGQVRVYCRGFEASSFVAASCARQLPGPLILLVRFTFAWGMQACSIACIWK